MLYPQVEWPTEAALMLAPYNPGLHGSNSVGRRGVCQWGDHSGEPDTKATWSAVWNGERWAVCDAHLPALARAEVGRQSSGGPPGRSVGDTIEDTDRGEDAATTPAASLADRFEAHLLADVALLSGRYDPRLFRQMIGQHGGVGTAQRLLADPRHTSYGFEKLWELGELERSVEFAVLLPWFRELFTEKEQQEAERRLLLHDFPLEQRLPARAASPPDWTRDR
jgi:hypothetical protein